MNFSLQKATRALRAHITWENWRLFYVVASISWLLGPSLNHTPSTRTAFISYYEDPGNPWSWLFRCFDFLAAILLAGALYVAIKRKRKSGPPFYTASIILLCAFAVTSAIDILFPSACPGCIVPTSISHAVHYGESIVYTAAILLVNLLWALRKDTWSRLVLFVQAVWIIIAIGDQYYLQSGTTPMQFAYQIVISLWVATTVPKLAGMQQAQTPVRRVPAVIMAISAWVFLSGFISIASAVLHLEELSEFSSVYFGNNTAWLSQHGVAVGIVLMYVSRHLWRGEHRAWQITSALLWIEAIKYAVVDPNIYLLLLYGLTAALLFRLQNSFDRYASSEQLVKRLKQVGVVVSAALAALVAGTILLRLKHHQDIDRLNFGFAQFARSLLLFKLTHFGPLPRRLLGQVLNIAGITLLLSILLSLFRPRRLQGSAVSARERQEALEHISAHSSSSEDYFKHWPTPKLYWWDGTRETLIAYRVVDSVAYALADPLASSINLQEQAIKDFRTYCRQHGWLCCFLMVGANSKEMYTKGDLKTVRIGASAVVDIGHFVSETANNKWWRWVRNKAVKQNWNYEVALPPHSPKLMDQLAKVSDHWLENAGHVERGFALGFFDKDYLQQCRLHLLKHDDELLAFANELPTFELPTATIDLMRYIPDTNHAMPTLLYHVILQLQKEGQKTRFDLGFVPLASASARAEQLVKQLGQLLIRDAISAKGLEQFKNKFGPTWEHNYIAFDGDWVDLLSVSRWLEPLLKADVPPT